MFLGLRTLTVLLLIGGTVASQSRECAVISVAGGRSTIVVDTAEPLEVLATNLAQHYGIRISAEQPEYKFSGDLEDVSQGDPEWSAQHPGARYDVPRRRRLEIEFTALSDGLPANVPELLQHIVDIANAQLPFAYRLDVDGEFSAFVPTRTRNSQGSAIETTPLLDRRITVPKGTRTLAESGRMLADALSSQITQHVSCCQAYVGGIPWGMGTAPFEASEEPARKVLERLIRLSEAEPVSSRHYWLVRCDSSWCSINVENVRSGICSKNGQLLRGAPHR